MKHSNQLRHRLNDYGLLQNNEKLLSFTRYINLCVIVLKNLFKEKPNATTWKIGTIFR